VRAPQQEINNFLGQNCNDKFIEFSGFHSAINIISWTYLLCLVRSKKTGVLMNVCSVDSSSSIATYTMLFSEVTAAVVAGLL
jgi:hypothetical protein